MDERLLHLYNQELQHLREMGSEFARQYPIIASRLGMENLEVADPYVERLLEGYAFMAARVQLQLNREFPRFTEHLLSAVSPQYTSPLPSMAIVRFDPMRSDGSLVSGPRIDRGTMLTSGPVAGSNTRVGYRTGHDVRLWPIEIGEVSYDGRGLGSLAIEGLGPARASLRLRLKAFANTTFDKIEIEDLDLHLRGGWVAAGLYEQLFTRVTGVLVHSTARPSTKHALLGPETVQTLGYEPEQALIPLGRAEYEGYRLLREYFAMPERFMFARLAGIGDALRRCEGDTVDVSILFDKAEGELEGAATEEHLSLHCTPCVNLFERRIDRFEIKPEDAEHHLIPDRAAPLDFEIYSVMEMTGYGTRGKVKEVEFQPFYSSRGRWSGREEAYYSLRRTPRLATEAERQGRRRVTSYAGSDVWVSLVDAEQAPLPVDIRQLGGRAWCTNRDLPIRMPLNTGKTDFSPDLGVPVSSVRCLGTPTPPKAAMPEGEHAWRLISHLMPNYFSILDTEGAKRSEHATTGAPGGFPQDGETFTTLEAGEALREILALYGETSRAEVKAQIEGVRAVSSEPIVRRIGRSGPVSFARGLQVRVLVDERQFEGAGAFVLGSVLERVMAMHATINTFTETVLASETRGDVKRWPHRRGSRAVL
ncbi:MAG: type VI secretion system baseplate subunit TssF [Planctomycetota bacterium]